MALDDTNDQLCNLLKRKSSNMINEEGLKDLKALEIKKIKLQWTLNIKQKEQKRQQKSGKTS